MTITTSRLFLFSVLCITGALILYYANGTYYEKNWTERLVEGEIIEDFELKKWNRSNSIGFLRRSSREAKTLILKI